jgi:hypothetical protein
MRVVRWALALLVLAGIGAGVWARLLAGGPVGPIPGGALAGEPAAELPADWTFANQEDYLAVESRAFRLPYSTSVWFMAHDGRLHLLLPSFFGDGLARRLAADPRIRVRLAGKLYDQRAVRVDEGAAPSSRLSCGARWPSRSRARCATSSVRRATSPSGWWSTGSRSRPARR